METISKTKELTFIYAKMDPIVSILKLKLNLISLFKSNIGQLMVGLTLTVMDGTVTTSRLQVIIK